MSGRQLNQLVELIQINPPPFIFIHDPFNSKPSPASFLNNALQSLNTPVIGTPIDLNEFFTAKALFHAIINHITRWTPELDAKGKAASWSNTQASRWDKSFDSFVEALKAAYDELSDRRKQKQRINFVLLFQNAERLKESFPSLVVPLIRLRELAQIPVTTIFISAPPWSEISPPIGTSPDPYMVTATSQAKQDVTSYLCSLFPSASTGPSASQPRSDAYHPVLKPLYATFVGVLYDACTPYTTESEDLAYIAYAMWPSFVRPLLEDWWADSEKHGQEDELDDGVEQVTNRRHQSPQKLPPDSATPLLIKTFLVAFQSSFPPLYNRTISATSFLRAQAAKPSFRLSQRFSASAMATMNASLSSSPQKTTAGTASGTDLGASLSTQKKLLLVAAYISSFNPARTDLRMFGRVAEGVTKKGRARRAGGISTGKSLFRRKAAKVPQVLLGPNSFTLERLLAIYGALVVEHGDGQIDLALVQPGETEVQVHRAAILMMVTEMIQLRLLSRIGQPERLDNSAMLKCNVGLDAADGFARDMKFNLSDLLWDPVV